jgi:hypothetical protein
VAASLVQLGHLAGELRQAQEREHVLPGRIAQVREVEDGQVIATVGDEGLRARVPRLAQGQREAGAGRGEPGHVVPSGEHQERRRLRPCVADRRSLAPRARVGECQAGQLLERLRKLARLELVDAADGDHTGDRLRRDARRLQVAGIQGQQGGDLRAGGVPGEEEAVRVVAMGVRVLRQPGHGPRGVLDERGMAVARREPVADHRHRHALALECASHPRLDDTTPIGARPEAAVDEGDQRRRLVGRVGKVQIEAALRVGAARVGEAAQGGRSVRSCGGDGCEQKRG